MGELGANPGKCITLLGLLSQQGGDGGSLVRSGSTLDTSYAAQERVYWSSCPIWKHLEGSLRTTAEGLHENSLSPHGIELPVI